MDHYQTLHISPNASQDEIKKAFRKLALEYHPDRNHSPDASLRFQQVQQAWQVLKDKRSREAYNYRRYTQQPQRAAKPLASTIEELHHESATLQRKTSSIDPFRLDYDLLLYEIRDLLSDHNLHVFLAGNDPGKQTEIFRNLLVSLRLLPYPLAQGLVPQLNAFAAATPHLMNELEAWASQAKWQFYWNRYKIWFALAMALLFCVWLWVMGR